MGWRRRASSIESLSDAMSSPHPIRRTWSDESYQRSPSLQSELLAGFQRLTTVDRTRDSDLSKLASNLESKFAGAKTPEKAGVPTPTTATPQTSPSPSSSQQSSPPSEKTHQGDLAKPQDETVSKAEKTTEDKPDQKTEDNNGNAAEQEPETQESKAEKKAALAVERKKAAHARYMRYYRSVHGRDPRFYSPRIQHA